MIQPFEYLGIESSFLVHRSKGMNLDDMVPLFLPG
jgi:hypothetical protein